MGNIFANGLFGTKKMKILMVGLDAAGKTTILYSFKLRKFITTHSTVGYNVETVKHKNITFILWDLGSSEKNWPIFRHYYPNTQGIIFVVNSTDHERIEEVREKLVGMLAEDELKDAVFLIFANKQDLPNAMTADELTEKIGLHLFRNRKWFVQPTCATNGDGLYWGLDWLSNQLNNINR